ncbi:MAG TPA: hypothetical protein VM261_12245 [Kofleriaceae bacterium]|nr:hypothetical protein [Kofleriaceae bacterium]
MDLWRVIAAAIASCNGAMQVALAPPPDELPAAEEYVYAVDGVTCTVMQCMVDDAELAWSMCCVRAIHTEFPYPPPKRKPPPPPGSPPETLSRDDVVRGIAAIRDEIDVCRDRRSPRRKDGVRPSDAGASAGTLKVSVVVSPDGTVESASETETETETQTETASRDAAFDACVLTAFRRAHFPRSLTGSRFRYPVAR